MRIEEAFRDLTSVLRLKKLRLKVNIEERLGRLVFGAILAVVVAAYLYLLALGQISLSGQKDCRFKFYPIGRPDLADIDNSKTFTMINNLKSK